MRASIIVPAHNASATIELCLQALLSQTRSSCEIIVVDDGSTDDTRARAAACGSVRLIHTPHLGAAAARNRGAREAGGEILLFTDADCEPAPDWIERMLAPFADPSCSVVGVKGVYRTRQKEPVARFVQLEYEEKYAQMSRENAIDFVDTYSAAYRRDVFLANRGFDESFPAASVEDQEFSFRLAKQGLILKFAADAAVYHRHVTSVQAYWKRKFRIGYWKVHLHRRHPDKVWRDSHTPFTLKLQVGLLPLVAAGIVLLPFVPLARWLFLLSAVALGVSMFPLVRLVIRRDRSLVAVVPVLVLLRAAALGTGLAAGAVGEFGRSSIAKRILDIAGGLVGLALSAPLMVLIAIAIKLDSPGPVLFRQPRAGQGGRPFRIYKFRSMVEGADLMLEKVLEKNPLPPPVFKIPNDPRVTRVGRWLRRWSLDELPQFFNVLHGEMGLVGPRPEELRITALYDEWQRRRLAVKPGLTGPMQISGRGELSLDERVQIELEYTQDPSVWRDLAIMLKTIPAVLGRRGAF